MRKRKRQINDELAALVNSRYRDAADANAEPHRRALECMQQYKGTLFDYGLEEDLISYRDVQMNITLPIVMGFKSMLSEILDPIISQPFTLVPTPIVTLPNDVAERLRQAIRDNIPQLIEMAGGDPNKLASVVDAFTEATRQYEYQTAQKAADRLTTAVKDRLIDAGFATEFDDWLWDLVVYPLAIMKGPIYEMSSARKWGTFGLSYSDEVRMKVRRISPFDFFPAPKAKDPHTCAYVIERMRVHSGQLLDLYYSDDNYDKEAIDLALEAYDSYILTYAVGGDDAPDSDSEVGGSENSKDFGYYDLLGYYGRIKGSALKEYGVQVEDERREYESEVWVLGDYVIKAVLSPSDKGRRPFEVMSYMSTTGELWGKSPTEIIRDAQRQCTAAGRALARNMEYSSGPIGEVVASNVIGEDDPEEIYPMMLRAVKATAGGQAVYRFYSVPSLANELMSVYDKFYRVGFDLLGIPPIAYGDATNAATLGRTSGGVAMVMNQASKPIKQAMAKVERQVTKPLIQKFVDEEMMFNDDINIRGDVEVQVNGVRSLAEKEQKDGALEWALQSLVPFAQGVQIPPEVILRLIRELFEQKGIDVKGLPSFEMLDAVQEDITTINPDPTGGMGAAPPVSGVDPTAQLDGRSQVAIDQINGSNSA